MKPLYALVYFTVTVTFLPFAPVFQGTTQSPSEVAGRYEGLAQAKVYGPVPLIVELRSEKNALLGSMHTPLGDFVIKDVTYSNGRLSFKAESYDDEGIITVVFKEGRFIGEFDGFGDKGTVELKRTGPPSPAVDTKPTDNLDQKKWREDLHYLGTELPQRHANAFHFVSRDQFERAVIDLDNQIPRLQNSDIVMGMARILAMIGDGHTHLDWWPLYAQVPLRLYWFGDQLRVIGTSNEYRRALGTRVIKVGGLPIKEVFARDLAYISQDESVGFIKSANAERMTSPAHLHALGLAPDITHAEYTFKNDAGKKFALTLATSKSTERVQWLDAARQTPLYRQRQDEPLWFTYLAAQKTLYFNFTGYPKRKVFEAFSQELFDFIDHHTIKRVIVDMRQNGGGDFTRGRQYIISKFNKRPAITKRGMLYVIIGRWTYSAGMANAADFRNDLNAILVGEPTGARPNGYQENREFSLPNSHLGVSYSTRLYKFQEKDTPGIMPDKRIDPDWRSYKSGVDAVLAWILRER
jgi:hypothetical protein